MDVRENWWRDPEEDLRAALDGLRKHMWFSLPVIVAEDSDGHTVTLQSAIKGMTTDQNGDVTNVELPLFKDVPVHFPNGGGLTLTHPVKKGDEGLIVFSSRPQDAWWQLGGVQKAVDTRMHSLSDGRYIPGGRSNPRKLNPSPSKVSTQLRSDDGKHFVDVHPQNGITLQTTATITQNTGSTHDSYVGSIHVKITSTRIILGDPTKPIFAVETTGGPSSVVFASL